MENLIILLFLLGIMVIPTLLMQRKQKKHLDGIRLMQSQLVVGDRVITTAGIYADVVGVSEEAVELEVAPGVVLTFERSAVLKKQPAAVAGAGAADATEATAATEGGAQPDTADADES